MPRTVSWQQAKVIVHRAAEEGVKDAGRLVFDATQHAVPVETSALKASGRLDIDGLNATISYGEGQSGEYATVVHEKLDLHHDQGTAKYIENPTRASAAKVNAVIAAAIRQKL